MSTQSYIPELWGLYFETVHMAIHLTCGNCLDNAYRDMSIHLTSKSSYFSFHSKVQLIISLFSGVIKRKTELC